MTDAINAQSDVLTESELDCVSGGMDVDVETVKQNQTQSSLQQHQSQLERFGR